MKTTTEISSAPNESDIQHTAYYLWNQNGRPSGRDAEFWFAAIELLKHRHAEVPPVATTAKKARTRRAMASAMN